jgi:uncharacterized membrane protein
MNSETLPVRHAASLKSLLTTASLTAGVSVLASYLFDPSSGQHRREVLRTRITGAGRGIEERTRTARRAVSKRSRQLTGYTKSLFTHRSTSSDEAVARRVRAVLEHTMSRPTVIGVMAQEGRIILHGHVSPQEHEQAMTAVRSVDGVVDVTDHLAEIQSADDTHVARGLDFRAERWSPGVRLLLGAAAGALMIGGIRQRTPLGVLAGVIGVPLLLRSTINRPLKRLGRRHGVIEVRKSIVVAAPVDWVFATLERYENFPAFMRNVRNVIRHEDGTSHWIVAGPAGSSLEWDSLTTVRRPNEMLAWHSVPGSRIEHSGIIRLERIDADHTAIDVYMSYTPPAGALGHGVAKLFGVDPQTEFDDDLARLKRLVETWKSRGETRGAVQESERESAAEISPRSEKKRRAAGNAEEGGLHDA